MRTIGRLGTTSLLALASCGAEGPCVDDATFFREQVYPKVIERTCMSCHTEAGLARDSHMVFVSTALPDHVEQNRRIFEDVAGLARDGTSLVLLKPLGEEDHGGGAVLTEDSEAWDLIRQYVDRLQEPVSCPGAGDDVDGDAGLVLLPPTATLRKAAIVLGGRLPTAAETDEVRAGGVAALERVLGAMMAEPGFLDVFRERLNDVLLTDRYLDGDDGVGLLDEDRFPVSYWFDDLEDDGWSYREATARSIAREPLSLATWILANDRPWTELLTADYTVVDAFSARSYGVTSGGALPRLDDPATATLQQARLDGFPHAGILSTPAYLHRYNTTETNRNRHRAWFFLKTFLATDVLTFAKRPIDPTTVSQAHNPTLNDPQCTVCHATMDPVAGTFQRWDDEGRDRPREDGWYAEMAPPGFGDAALPHAAERNPTRWLAEQAVADPRFAIASVRLVLSAFTGLELLTSETAGDDPVRRAALDAQDAWIADAADDLVAHDFDLKVAIRRVVLSRYFRATADAGADDGALWHAGTAHLLTPEELDRKIVATTGFPWRRSPWEDQHDLLDRYLLLYGGIDNFGVTTRLREPNGVIASVGLRMANEMACVAVPADLVLARGQRRLLPHVETSYAPLTPDGFAVPEAEAAIKRNLQWMHLRLLGEELSIDDPELQASYDLWFDTWHAGRELIARGEADTRLPDGCRADVDPFTGDGLPDERRVDSDPDFTVRAWVAVAAYLLSDWRFLHE